MALLFGGPWEFENRPDSLQALLRKGQSVMPGCVVDVVGIDAKQSTGGRAHEGHRAVGIDGDRAVRLGIENRE